MSETGSDVCSGCTVSANACPLSLRERYWFILSDEEPREPLILQLIPSLLLHCAAAAILFVSVAVLFGQILGFWPGLLIGLGGVALLSLMAVRSIRAEICLALMKRARGWRRRRR